MNQEYLIKLSLFEQQANQYEEHLNLIEKEMIELAELKLSLDKLEKSREKEILAGLGKGIYIKTKLDKKELFVNIGSRVVVNKSFSEIRKIIDSQVGKLGEMKPKIHLEIEKIKRQLDRLVEDAESEQDKDEDEEKQKEISKAEKKLIRRR